jgi:hypothetical protein
MEKSDFYVVLTVVNTLLIFMMFTKLYSVKEPFSLQKMENDLVMLDKAGNVIQYPLKNVFDAINGAKTEAISHANSLNATLKTHSENRMRDHVKWALTSGNKNALAGNLWADMNTLRNDTTGSSSWKVLKSLENGTMIMRAKNSFHGGQERTLGPCLTAHHNVTSVSPNNWSGAAWTSANRHITPRPGHRGGGCMLVQGVVDGNPVDGNPRT